MLGHTIGTPLFDIIHHGMIFGLGLCAGLAGVAYAVSRRSR